MTAPAPFPDPADKEAVRRWMRENRRTGTGTPVPTTPEEFAAVQRRRLLRSVDVPEEGAALRSRLDLALTGEATSEHTVRVSVLGPFLANFQESVSAVAQALTGRPTSSASIPRSIREATALSASAVFPSSFGLAVYGPQGDGADGLFPEPAGETRPILDNALDAVLDVVDLSEGAGQASELLAEKLVPLGQRAMKHLGALTMGLTEARLGLRVAWHAPNQEPRYSQWSPAGAERVRYLCEHSEFDNAEIIRLVGWLGSASALRGTVEIRTDNGQVIQASTEESLTPRLAQYFGNRVEAEVEVTRVTSAGGRERRIFAILGLSNL